MPDVPFYSNTPDDSHCFQACIRSILKYFEPDKEFSWEELDSITNKPEGLWTWPMAGLSWMAKNGYAVIDIEPFDYKRFISEGKVFMEELWGKEIVKEQEQHSDIPLAQKDSEEFLRTVDVQFETPNTEDINSFLDAGYLVICILNARKMDEKEGFVGHAILVVNHDDTGFVVHDPGLPALEARHVTYSIFNQAWSDPNSSARNLAAVKLL